MKFAVALTCLSFASLVAQNAVAQTAVPVAPGSDTVATSTAGDSISMNSFLPDLDRLKVTAEQAAVDIGHLRIDKWKADSQSKQQAQSSADSIQRNLTTALPALMEAVRATPQDLTSEFKLYRNLNALHDVFGALTESAGAFGPKSDYEALEQQFQTIASVQHDLGEALERLAASTQLELNQLRAQVRAQQAPVAVAPPKKVVVDDTAPASKTSRKKKKTSGSSSGAPSDESGSNAGTITTPKS